MYCLANEHLHSCIMWRHVCLDIWWSFIWLDSMPTWIGCLLIGLLAFSYFQLWPSCLFMGLGLLLGLCIASKFLWVEIFTTTGFLNSKELKTLNTILMERKYHLSWHHKEHSSTICVYEHEESNYHKLYMVCIVWLELKLKFGLLTIVHIRNMPNTRLMRI